jgi:hypothetical protein
MSASVQPSQRVVARVVGMARHRLAPPLTDGPAEEMVKEDDENAVGGVGRVGAAPG